VTEPSDSRPTPPIVCTLGGSGQAKRFEEWRALAREALVVRSVRPDGAVLRYRRASGSEAELRRLVALEADCCAFLNFVIEPSGHELRLTVTGPAKAVPLIHEGWGTD
jgi:hypothetical protein